MTHDEQGVGQWAGVEYDDQSEQWKAAGASEFSDDAIDQDRGAVSLLGLPFAFFFRPSRFMRSFAVHMSGGLLFTILWMIGASLVLMKFENKISFGTGISWFPESWGELAVFAVGAGLLRGGFLYGLGGWWYRLRLNMCGVDNASWNMTGRVYISAGVFKHLVYLTAVVLGATQHDSYIEYVQNQPAIQAMVVGGVVVVFEVWSSFTLYFGTRAVFPVKKLWAMVWFLVLPILLRLGALAILLGVILFSGVAAEPELNQPTNFVGETFRFQYPSNWYISKDEHVPSPESWFQAEPFIGDAFFEFEIMNTNEGEDIVESAVENYVQNAGMSVDENPKALLSQGRFEGHGYEYQAQLEGDQYLFRLFDVEIEPTAHLLITVIVAEDSWEKLEPGYAHILKTLAITKPSELEPDLASTYRIRHDPVEFDIPGNWWGDVYQGEDQENEDGSVHSGMLSILAEPPGAGYFRVMVYESSLNPRAELGITIADYTDDSRLIDEEPIEEWLGLEGIGVTGKVAYEGHGYANARFIISKLPDGRLIEVRRVIPDEVSEIYAPGFDHIESTFHLRVDPSSLDSSSEP